MLEKPKKEIFFWQIYPWFSYFFEQLFGQYMSNEIHHDLIFTKTVSKSLTAFVIKSTIFYSAEYKKTINKI